MTTLAPPLKSAAPLPIWPIPHRFSVAEYDRMGELGLIPEKTELIRGEVIDKMPQGNAHSMCLDLLNRLLIGLIPLPTTVRCQSPIILADSMPEPDFSISSPGSTRGGSRPTAADVYLLIEVSDSTLAGDRSTKLELYAENGIPEYWIVNLPDDCVEVYTRPVAAELRYDSKIVYGRGQSVPLAIAGVAPASIAVDSLLP